MPTYANWFEVDWRWNELQESERVIVRRYNHDLQADPETVSWTALREILGKASGELPGRTIRARGADPDDDEEDVEHEWAFAVSDRAISEHPDDFDAEGGVPEERVLSASSQDKICQPLYFDEAMLKEIESEAYRQDRSLSWMAQKAWVLARAEIRRLPVYAESTAD